MGIVKEVCGKVVEFGVSKPVQATANYASIADVFVSSVGLYKGCVSVDKMSNLESSASTMQNTMNTMLKEVKSVHGDVNDFRTESRMNVFAGGVANPYIVTQGAIGRTFFNGQCLQVIPQQPVQPPQAPQQLLPPVQQVPAPQTQMIQQAPAAQGQAFQQVPVQPVQTAQPVQPVQQPQQSVAQPTANPAPVLQTAQPVAQPTGAVMPMPQYVTMDMLNEWGKGFADSVGKQIGSALAGAKNPK